MTADDDSMELKRHCVDLLFDCPHNRASLTCPFRKVREMDVVVRVNWLKGLNIKELQSLTKHHSACCEKRTYPILPK